MRSPGAPRQREHAAGARNPDSPTGKPGRSPELPPLRKRGRGRHRGGGLEPEQRRPGFRLSTPARRRRQLALVPGPLTGLHNRRHFFDLAEYEFRRAQRFGHPLSVIMLDIDHFKQVNDAYGHIVGDQVLRGVAERCREILRDIDLLGRYGGEEFTALLPETRPADARQVAERMRQIVARTAIETESGPVTVTICLGHAIMDEGSHDLDALLDHADQALYQAKNAGRNRVSSWNSNADPGKD